MSPVGIAFTFTVVNKSDGVLGGEGSKFFSSGDGFRNGTSSLLNPVNDVLIGSTTVVINRAFNVSGEELQGGETLNGESGSEILLFSGINLSENSIGIFSSQSGSSLSVFRGEFLAVATPGSVEFNQNEFFRGNEVIEVRVSQDVDTIFNSGSSVGQSTNS